MQIIFTRAFHADVMVPTNYTYMCCIGAAHGIMNQARALVSTSKHIFGKAGRCWELRWLWLSKNPPKVPQKPLKVAQKQLQAHRQHGMVRGGGCPADGRASEEGMQGV